jgi:hypothetical protein
MTATMATIANTPPTHITLVTIEQSENNRPGSLRYSVACRIGKKRTSALRALLTLESRQRLQSQGRGGLHYRTHGLATGTRALNEALQSGSRVSYKLHSTADEGHARTSRTSAEAAERSLRVARQCEVERSSPTGRWSGHRASKNMPCCAILVAMQHSTKRHAPTCWRGA